MISPLDRCIQALECLSRAPRAAGDRKWTARCPAHDDQEPSLSIGLGRGDLVLLNCHAGCRTEDVVAALGLTMADLMPEVVSQCRTVAVTYSYEDENGKTLFEVVRYEPKDFRQRVPLGNGEYVWSLKDVRRVLYRLPQVIEAVKAGKTIYVVEGEKDVHSMGSVAVATTSPGGAGKWKPEYSECLRGADVVVIADKDKAGLNHAHQVQAALCGVASAVRIVQPAVGKDVTDHLATGKDLTDLIPVDTTPPKPDARTWQPFPTGSLPTLMRVLVQQGSAALGCDESYLAVPLLAVVSGCLGNRAVLELKSSWHVPSVLWIGIIGESGSLKSPALDLLLGPLGDRESALIRDFNMAVQEHERSVDVWKDQRKAGRGEKPQPPDQPERLLVSDVTTEAVATRLGSSPLGLLLYCDELGAWFKSFDAYRGGGGGPDAQRWLSAHDARQWIVDRKADRPMAIPKAAVSIIGGIQPGVLRAVLKPEHLDNGLAARLFLAWPPRKSKKWREATVPQETLDRYATMLVNLLDMAPEQSADEGGLRPRVLTMTPGAKAKWVGWYDRNARHQNAADGLDASMLSKLEGGAARIALVVHLARVTAGDPDADLDQVDEVSMDAGIRFAEWLGAEGLRIHERLRESQADTDRHRLVEVLQRQPSDRISVRSLMRNGPRPRMESAEDARAALDDLATHGFGHWKQVGPGDKGGRPSVEFVLNQSGGDGDTTHKTAGSEQVLSPSPSSSEGDDVAIEGGSGGVAHLPQDPSSRPQPGTPLTTEQVDRILGVKR
jgi:hypothetical protein